MCEFKQVFSVHDRSMIDVPRGNGIGPLRSLYSSVQDYVAVLSTPGSKGNLDSIR